MLKKSNSIRFTNFVTFSSVVLSCTVGIFGNATSALASCEDDFCFLLRDRNSIVYTEGPSLEDWYVDGVDHLANSSYFYRIGNNGRERSLWTLNLDSLNVSNSNGRRGLDTLTGVWTDNRNRFNIEIKWSLSGGRRGSGVSAINEQVSITNKRRNQDLKFHLFEYDDFDLSDTIGDDIGVFENINVYRQFDDETTVLMSQIAIDASKTRYEANDFPLIIDRLENGSTNNLRNRPSFGKTLSGDVTSAWQWTFNIDPKDTVIISKNKSISSSATPVPEPLTILGSATALSFGAFFKRQCAKKKKS